MRGRAKGSRNKLSTAFLTDLCDEWREGGKEAVRVMRLERPGDFVKVVAQLLPAQFEISDSRLKEIPDEQLDEWIARRLAEGFSSGSVNDGTPKKAH